MGKGGYNGGSTIIGPWSSGWFSKTKGKAKAGPSEEELAAKAKRKAKAAAKEAARLAAQNGKKAAQKITAHKAANAKHTGTPETNPRPGHHKTPEEIAERLAARMKGVVVTRYTSRTLRLRKPPTD